MPNALARPVQKFKPTTGPLLGCVGIALCAVVVGVVLTSERNVVGLRMALGAALVAVLSYVALIRPRATAYEDRLVLRGLVSDTTLPLAGIDAVVVRHMLVVSIGADRYTCAGIARSKRSMGRRPSHSAMPGFGLQQTDHRMGAMGAGGSLRASPDYPTFVETRIEDLARSARRDGLPAPAVRREWARAEIAAIALTGLAFVLSLFVR